MKSGIFVVLLSLAIAAQGFYPAVEQSLQHQNNKKNNVEYNHFLPNKINEDLEFDIPIINAVSICSEYPNFHFEGSNELYVQRDKGERICRVLIKFNTTSYTKSIDKGFEATLTLNTVNSFGNPSRKFSVFPVPLRGNVDGSTWNSEFDTKLTSVNVNGVVMTNAFADPDNGINWNGGFFSDPKPGYSKRLRQGELTFDVAHILESGLSGMMVTYDREDTGSSDETFQGINTQNPPTLKVVRRKVLDNLDEWPENYNCRNEFRTVKAPLSGIDVVGHAFYCESTTREGRQHNCVIGTGVPWYADLNANRFMQFADELREKCNIIFPNLMCSGQEGAASGCPDKSLVDGDGGFKYGLQGEEHLWYGEWFFGANPLIPEDQNVDMFIAWDRFGPYAMIMKTLYPTRWLGGIEADSWYRSLACSDEGAQIPHGQPGHCNQFGFMFERCQFWDTETNECTAFFPPFSIVDCIARTDKCSRCLGDYNEEFSAVTRWWVNSTRATEVVGGQYTGLNNPAAADIRKSCYALDNLNGLTATDGFFFNFSPHPAWGTYYDLTDKELFITVNRRLNAAPGQNFVIEERHYPAMLTMQSVPEGTSFIQPNGELPSDAVQGQVFIDAVNFRKVSGEAVMFLEQPLGARLTFNQGSFLVNAVDVDFVQSDANPTASVIYVPNNAGHAFTHTSPQLANRLAMEFMTEVAPQVRAQQAGHLQVSA